MAINPLTGLEEDENKFTTPGGINFDIKQDAPLEATTITDQPLPAVKGATEQNPIVSKGVEELTPTTISAPGFVEQPTGGVSDTGARDLRVDKIGEVLSDQEKRTLIDKERDRIRNLQGISFDERNKQFKKMQEDIKTGAFFGGETQMEAERAQASEQERIINKQAGEAISTAEELFRADLERETRRIRDQGQQVMNTTQRLNSLRGGGRSTANEKMIQEQQGQINSLVSTAQQNADLKLQERKLQIEGAKGEALTGIREALAANEKVLNERIAEATQIQQELDSSIKADFTESASNITGILEAGGVPVDGIDLKTTQDSGVNYFLKADGNLWINPKTGKPEVFKKNEFDQTVKLSNFKDANDNTYVYANGTLDSIITREGRILRGAELDTVNVPAQVAEDKSLEDNRKIESQLRNEFIKRPEVKRFQEIRAQFERVKQGADANNASGDIALVFAFMKMLDPGSVVRESEFATAQNAAGVPDQVRNLYNKALKGTRLGEDQRKEFKSTAESLLTSEIENFENVKEGFRTIIEDAGARPDFVIVGEDLTTTPTFKLGEEEESEIDSIFGPAPETGPQQFKTSSGKTFNLDFNLPDQTGGAKGIPESGFEEKIGLNRTGTNVAKDTNNPGNITADSIPAGNTKEEYGKAIGATGTYLSPNGREYFVFPDVTAGTGALKRDITAKISGRSRNIKPTDTLERFQRVYVGNVSPNYLAVLKRITGANNNTKIKDIDADLLTEAVMKAEGFNS